MTHKREFSPIWHHLKRIGRIIWFRMGYDQNFLWASSLSFQTVLSVVPLLAVMFGIAKGFGLEALLESILQDEFRDQKEVIDYFIQFGYRLLEETRGGLVAGIGTIVLLFTIMKLFANIENALNFMWGVKEGRPVARKLSDYLALILTCPILIVASSSLTVFMTTKVHQITSSGSLPDQIGPLLLFTIPIIPYVMTVLLFTLVYIILPYKNVKLSSSLFASIFAGFSYQIMQASYISLQIKISNAGAIYGSFAALPLFLTWLYISWVIFLIGAEIVVIHQERLWDPHIMAPYRTLSHFERRLTYLACVKIVVDGYIAKSPASSSQLSKELRLPERLVNELLGDLSTAHIIIQAANGDIIPGESPETLKIFDVLHQVEGVNQLPASIIEYFGKLLDSAAKLEDHSPANKLIKEIVLPE